ncbi:MAG: sugar phosphate isomerase/epimerase family protein, partial [Spirochaetota bacterium]
TGQIFATGRCSFASADQSVRKQAEDLFAGLVDVAAELGAMINVGRVRGAVEGNGDRKSVESRVADSLQRMTELASSCGVRIALEPVNRYEIDFLNSCAEAVSFMERHHLDGLRLMPDIFHMNMEDQSIEGSLMRFVDRIGYVHFADSNRHYPGAGHQDFRSIVGALRMAGYEGWIGAEILPYPDPDTAARNAVEYLRRFL